MTSFYCLSKSIDDGNTKVAQRGVEKDEESSVFTGCVACHHDAISGWLRYC